MEGLAMNPEFWLGRRVLITGHTGFKGSWLSMWLQNMGAQVAGYSLRPPAGENLFTLASVGERMESVFADVRDCDALQGAFERYQPEIVFHMAAQALVRTSYTEPVETFQVNVMGTVHLLESVRNSRTCRAVVNVTSDKCYENREWIWGYREQDPMGGHDPYSCSKGCSELITAAYRCSYFAGNDGEPVGIATARAGNVIAGGDFSKDRIIPDCLAALTNREVLRVRSPDAVRPWQHVLEPLSGYLVLAERLWQTPRKYNQGWNFGPGPDDVRPVRWIVERMNHHCGGRLQWEIDHTHRPHEASLLMLDSAKARGLLGWKPRWTLDDALKAVIEWHGAYERGECLRNALLRQIASYDSAVPVH